VHFLGPRFRGDERRTDSNVKQPSIIGPCLATRVRRHSFFLPPSYRGSGAPSDAPIKSIRTAAVEACEACRHGRRAGRTLLRARTVTHAPNGAPLAAILGLGTVLPGAGHARPRRLSLLLPHLVQPFKAAHLVGADGAPWPPGAWLRATPQAPHQPTPLSGAGPLKLLRQQNASRWRPRDEQGVYSLSVSGAKSRKNLRYARYPEGLCITMGGTVDLRSSIFARFRRA